MCLIRLPALGRVSRGRRGRLVGGCIESRGQEGGGRQCLRRVCPPCPPHPPHPRFPSTPSSSSLHPLTIFRFNTSLIHPHPCSSVSFFSSTPSSLHPFTLFRSNTSLFHSHSHPPPSLVSFLPVPSSFIPPGTLFHS